jgi:phosphatidylglycerol:prolipoprotein diacylglycerol transferase
MYPTLSYFIYDLTGKYYPLPFFTFGIMMALSFVAAYLVFLNELKRKEMEGIIYPRMMTKTFGKPAGITDIIIGMLIGGLLGYKIIGLLMNYSDNMENPQDYLLSKQGSFIGFAAGVALSVYTSWRDWKKTKEKTAEPYTKEVLVSPHELMGNFLMIAAISGLIGAKLFDSLENFNEFVNDPIGQITSFSGLTFYGGLICGGAGVLWYARKNGIPLLHMLDIGGPGMMLAYGVGRIGCQLAGDGDWGIVNLSPKPGWMSFLPDWMWSFNFPRNVNKAGEVVLSNVPGPYKYALSQPVYPTAFYEAILGILLFLFLWSIRKKIKIPGLLFSIYLLISAAERFFIELIRVNIKYTWHGFAFTQAEMISVLLFIVGLGMGAFLLIRKPAPKEPGLP